MYFTWEKNKLWIILKHQSWNLIRCCGKSTLFCVFRKAHVLWLTKLQVLVRVLLSLPTVTIFFPLSAQIEGFATSLRNLPLLVRAILGSLKCYSVSCSSGWLISTLGGYLLGREDWTWQPHQLSFRVIPIPQSLTEVMLMLYFWVCLKAYLYDL